MPVELALLSAAAGIFTLCAKVYQQYDLVNRFRTDCGKLCTLVKDVEYVLRTAAEEASEMTAKQWNEALKTLEEPLKEVLAVFKECETTSVIAAMFKGKSLNTRLDRVSQRLMVALQLIPIQQTSASSKRLLDAVGDLKHKLQHADFAAVREAQQYNCKMEEMLQAIFEQQQRHQQDIQQQKDILQAQRRQLEQQQQAFMLQLAHLLQSGHVPQGQGQGLPRPAIPSALDLEQLDRELSDLQSCLTTAQQQHQQKQEQYLSQTIKFVKQMQHHQRTQTLHIAFGTLPGQQQQQQPQQQQQQQQLSHRQQSQQQLQSPPILRVVSDPSAMASSSSSSHLGSGVANGRSHSSSSKSSGMHGLGRHSIGSNMDVSSLRSSGGVLLPATPRGTVPMPVCPPIVVPSVHRRLSATGVSSDTSGSPSAPLLPSGLVHAWDGVAQNAQQAQAWPQPSAPRRETPTAAVSRPFATGTNRAAAVSGAVGPGAKRSPSSPNLLLLEAARAAQDPGMWRQLGSLLSGEPHIDLSRRGLSDADVESLALYAAPMCTRVTHLDLSNNSITSRGAAALAQYGAQHWRLLEVLNLSGNSIGPEGAKALAEQAARLWPYLQQLQLQGNGIGVAGAAALAAAAACWPHLTHLGLQHNEIGNRGALAFAPPEVLQCFCRMQQLDLRFNGISADYAQMLSRAAKKMWGRPDAIRA